MLSGRGVFVGCGASGSGGSAVGGKVAIGRRPAIALGLISRSWGMGQRYSGEGSGLAAVFSARSAFYG